MKQSDANLHCGSFRLVQFCPVPRVYLGVSHGHVVFVGFRFVCTETYFIIVLIYHETDGKF